MVHTPYARMNGIRFLGCILSPKGTPGDAFSIANHSRLTYEIDFLRKYQLSNLQVDNHRHPAGLLQEV
jgi:hypothetical protein